MMRQKQISIMRDKRRIFTRISLVVFLTAGGLFTSAWLRAGLEDELKRKQEELARIRKEIDMYDDRIKESERRESRTLELLDNFDRQGVLLKRLIASLRDDERKLQQDIDETRRSITELGGQIAFLKRHYATYVHSVYKYGRTYDLELLLSSRSINQMYIRAQYLQKFSQQRKNDLTKINRKREDVEHENLVLQAQLTRQRTLITEKSREEDRLQAKMRQRKQLLVDIRKNKINYQHEIDRKKTAAKDIEQIIAKLIEEERIRKEREAELARERKEPVPTPELAGGAFETRRGKLRWPVVQGRIAARFGNQQHPVLKTFTQNTGIDITVPPGTDVLAVAPGEVSTIWWLPSFGNLIILNHYSGYRTVYAHLSEIDVREGETISEGARIGKSGESLSGPMVHFEVWKYRDKQDPEMWLRPQGLTQR